MPEKTAGDVGLDVGAALFAILIAALGIVATGTVAPALGVFGVVGTATKSVLDKVRSKEKDWRKDFAERANQDWLSTEWRGVSPAIWWAISDEIARFLNEHKTQIRDAVVDETLPDMGQVLLDIGGQQMADNLARSDPDQGKMCEHQLGFVAEHLQGMRSGDAKYFKVLMDVLGDVKATVDATHQDVIQIAQAVVPSPFQRRIDGLSPFRAPRVRDDFLDYMSNKVTFVGRKDELSQLHAFCDDPALVTWAAITGPGGTGKSRLARTLCEEMGKVGWKTLFVSDDTFFAELFSDWSYPKNLLMVVDYMTGRAEKVGVHLMQADNWARAHGANKLRWLLIDRDGFATAENAKRRADENQPLWYRQLIYGRRGVEQLAYHDDQGLGVITLPTLSPDDMKAMLGQVDMPKADQDSVIEALGNIDPEHSRPLYLLAVAKAWPDKPEQAHEAAQSLPGLLKLIYQHDVEIVQRACQGTSLDGDAANLLDVWAYATATGPITHLANLAPGSYPADLLKYLDGSRMNQLAGISRATAGSHKAEVEPYTPDITGEFLTLSRLPDDEEELSHFVNCAWTNQPDQFLRFLVRAYQDFSQGKPAEIGTGFGSLLVPGQGLLQMPTGGCQAKGAACPCRQTFSDSIDPIDAYTIGQVALSAVFTEQDVPPALTVTSKLASMPTIDPLASRLAMALVNLTAEETNPATIQTIIDTQLTPLANRFPDNPDINMSLGGALFNQTVRQPEHAQAIIDDQLKPLANRFKDNPDINLTLAKALFNQTVRQPDQAQAVIEQFELLLERFPQWFEDDGPLAGMWPTDQPVNG